MKCVVVVVYFIQSFIAKQDNIILYNKQNKKTEKVQTEKVIYSYPQLL